jgi:hypothetical protein
MTNPVTAKELQEWEKAPDSFLANNAPTSLERVRRLIQSYAYVIYLLNDQHVLKNKMGRECDEFFETFQRDFQWPTSSSTT